MKLKLRLDDLQVDTFQTTPVPNEKGTVFGEQCTCPGVNTCDATCAGPTCNASCQASCVDNTCAIDVYGTCGLSCPGTCYDTCPCTGPRTYYC
jgi:hypothetical protein